MLGIIIICHNGDLEIKTEFLIYTLKKYLKGNYTIYVAIPDSNAFVKPPSRKFHEYCKNQLINIYNFHNHYLDHIIKIKEGDLISNKIFALQKTINKDYLLFLDSDTLFIKETKVEDLIIQGSSLLLKPANRNNIPNWDKIFDKFNLSFPENSVLSSLDNQKMPPYFNSGVIVFNQIILSKLLVSWQNYFQFLSLKKNYKNIYYPLFHRDQIALTLAINELKINYTLLNEKYNFPIVCKNFNESNVPCIVHYHNPLTLYLHPILKKELLEFYAIYPDLIDIASWRWKGLFRGRIYIKIIYQNILRLKRYKKIIQEKIKI